MSMTPREEAELTERLRQANATGERILSADAETYAMLSPAAILLQVAEDAHKFQAIRDLIKETSLPLWETLTGDSCDAIGMMTMQKHGLTIDQAQRLSVMLIGAAIGTVSPLGPDLRREIIADLEVTEQVANVIAGDFEHVFIRPNWSVLQTIWTRGKRIAGCKSCDSKKNVKCPTCSGTGKVAGFLFAKTCSNCGGASVVKCSQCNGMGAVWVPRGN